MSFRAEMEALRAYLDELARLRNEDEVLFARYALRRPPLPPGLYWQLRWVGGRMLRWLEEMRLLPPAPWPASLKQAATTARAKPLLIWAVGMDRDSLRDACGGFLRLQDSLPEFAPVLITDVADFAYFSRLGWLVEYVPKLYGQRTPYEETKARFLARLYRDAPALPARAGLARGPRAEELRRLLVNAKYARFRTAASLF